MGRRMKYNYDKEIYRIMMDKSGVHTQKLDAEYKSMEGAWINNHKYLIPYDEVYCSYDLRYRKPMHYKYVNFGENEWAYVAYSWIEPNSQMLNDLIDKVKNDIDIQMEEAERAFTEAKAKIESLSVQKDNWNFSIAKSEFSDEFDLEME